MGRRRRKQQTYRPSRATPKDFACPNCGGNMKVETLKAVEDGFGTIKCSNCLLEETYPANPLTEPVDIYSMLIDHFYGDGEDGEEGIDGTTIVKKISLDELKSDDEDDKEESENKDE